MQSQTGLVWLLAFGLALAVFLAMELRKWRRLDGVLSHRQRTLRVVNIGVLAVIVVLLAIIVSGVVRTPAAYVGLVGAVMLLLFVVVALTMRDLRELSATRTAREVRIAEDIARVIAAEVARERRATPRPGDDDGG